MKIGTPQIQKILQEKVPPLSKDDPLTVTNSVVILLSMKVDALERQNAQLIRAIRTLAQGQIAGGEEATAEENSGEDQPIDRTPFPAGFNPGTPSAGPGSPSEDLTPNNNVVGGAVNVQPIPSKAPSKGPVPNSPTPNGGSKTVRQ